MKISNYFFSHSTIKNSDYMELLEDRKGYTTQLYLKRFKKEFSELRLKGRTAFLLASGVTISQSESRTYTGKYENSLQIEKSGLIIKETTTYSMHKYIGALQKNNNITYANINSNSCASSMYSIYEAETLLESSVVDNVVIVAEERTSFNTIRIFDEHQIEVTPGDGFACMVLTNDEHGIAEIDQTKWGYHYSTNPFYVSAEGYKQVNTEADYVKGHGTGTVQNTEAEAILSDKPIGEYKSKIGHTQGASALIEICMVLEDEMFDGSILCTASGLGGFYGSCVVHK